MPKLFKKQKHFAIFLCCMLLLSCSRGNRGLVVGKIQQAAKLATTEFTIEKLVYGTKEKKIFIFTLNKARIVAYSQVVVKTGIDLKRLKKDDIIIDGPTVEVTLPPVEVINFSYPTENIKIDGEISDPDKFLNSIKIDDLEEFLRQAELDIRKNLKYMGIVETTQEKTRALLTSLLRNLGYEEIHIGFKSDELIGDKILLDQES